MIIRYGGVAGIMGNHCYNAAKKMLHNGDNDDDTVMTCTSCQITQILPSALNHGKLSSTSS
jgi:hypothetical protein